MRLRLLVFALLFCVALHAEETKPAAKPPEKSEKPTPQKFVRQHKARIGDA